MSNMIERIKAQLKLEMLDLTEFLEDGGREGYNETGELNTKEVVIRYTVKNQEKFMILGYEDIIRIMRARASSLKRELG